MRIDGTYRPAISTRSAARSGDAGGGFRLDASGTSARPAAIANAPSSAGLDTLLALQSVDDPVLARKKTIRRGRALIDALDDVRADLLAGRVAEGRLNQLMVMVGQARDPSDPNLDALIDDIELRARVELAKFGKYPA